MLILILTCHRKRNCVVVNMKTVNMTLGKTVIAIDEKSLLNFKLAFYQIHRPFMAHNMPHCVP